MKKFFVLALILISTNLISTKVTTKEKTQIQWVDGVYTKSITDEFIISSKDFNKSKKTGRGMMMPLGSGDFSGDGIPEIVYGMQFTDLKKGSFIKPIFLTTSLGKGLSLFKPIMDVVPYVSAPRDSVIADFNGDGINDIFIADHGVDYEPFPGYQNSLILSAPNGKFINASSTLPQILDFTHGATSGDIDSDGDIDLFVTQAGSKEDIPHYFLRNNGKGVFTQVKVGELLDKRYSYLSHTQNLKKKKNLYFTPGLEFIDDDDKLDLILLSGKLEGGDSKIIFGSNSGFKKKNALKLKAGRFGNKNIGYNYLVTDIDDDGDNDIIILHTTNNLKLGITSHVGTDLQVLIQDKNRKFVDKSDFYFPGIAFDYGSFGVSMNLIDLNNDNKKDLTIFSFHGINDPFKQKIKGEIKQAPPKVFIRQDDGSFRPLNNDLLIGDDEYTFGGIRPIDIDNDGDIEFVVHKKINDTEQSVQIVELTTNKDEAMYQSNKPIEIIASALFDGRYSFDISRYNEKDGSNTLGNGFIKIQNGIMIIESENRTLDSGSPDVFDTFIGKIDNKGNINGSLKVSALFGEPDLKNVNLSGNIDDLLKGQWDDYYDITFKLEKKQFSSTTAEHKLFSSEEIDFLMTAKGDDEKCIRDQFYSGLDLLRKDTLFHERYYRWEVASVLKDIVKDCLN